MKDKRPSGGIKDVILQDRFKEKHVPTSGRGVMLNRGLLSHKGGEVTVQTSLWVE